MAKKAIDINESLELSLEQKLAQILSGESPLSYSALNAFKKNPLEFVKYKFGTKEQTDAMIFGTLVHAMVLESETVWDSFILLPADAPKKPTSAQINAKKPSEDTLKQIAWWENFGRIAMGKTIIDADEFARAEKMRDALLKNRISSYFLNRMEHPEYKFEMKIDNFNFIGFIDGYHTKSFKFDLKVVQDANPKIYQRDAIKNGIHLQAAIYDMVGNQVPFFVIAIDHSHNISVNEISPELMAYGKQELSRLLGEFNRCILENRWYESYEFYSERWDGVYAFDKPSYL